MIIFNNIRWKNFLATGNNFIEISLDDKNLKLLSGQSGSGKSTLLDAIVFVLYGRPFRNIKKEKIVNAVNNKDCLVEIEFTIGDVSYKVRRGIKPNIFEIYRNNVLIDQEASVKDYQYILETNILCCSLKSFIQIVVLGAANFTPFMQLTAGDRRTIIESLLDIEVFSSMNDLLKEKVSNNKLNIKDLLQSKQLVVEKINYQNKYIKTLVDENSLYEQNSNKIIQELKSKQKQLETIIEDNTSKVSSLKEKLFDIDEINKLFNKYNTLDIKLTNNLSILKTNIKFFNENDICNVCKQDISKEFKQQKIENSNEKITAIENGLVDISKHKENINKKIDYYSKLNNSISKLEIENKNLNEQLNYLKNNIKENEKILNSSKVPEDKLKSEDKILKDLNTELSNIEKDIIELTKEKELFDYGLLLLKDNGIKTSIIKNYLPIINDYVNKFLNSMNFFVSFHMNEEFKEDVKSRGRDTFSYENFSEGERQRIDLALLFTWRVISKMKNAINTNLLIMDEVLDSYLDTETTENVITMLRSEIFKGSNIIVISHKNEISEKFDENIKFQKVKGFSRKI